MRPPGMGGREGSGGCMPRERACGEVADVGDAVSVVIAQVGSRSGGEGMHASRAGRGAVLWMHALRAGGGAVDAPAACRDALAACTAVVRDARARAAGACERTGT